MNYHLTTRAGNSLKSSVTPRFFIIILVLFFGISSRSISQGHPATDDEFVGPFPSWINVKTQYGAVGDGVADETAVLQAALNAIGNTNSTASVVYLPAGTYRITGTLTMNNKISISIIGADPLTTKIIWGGAINGTMLQINGTAYSRFNRITWDGNNIANIGVDQSWDGGQDHFDTGNEYADNIFKNVGIGIRGGHLGHGFAETAIMRCKFINNTIAGITLGNFNALDVWVWHSIFENCAVGITNNNTVSSAGNFKVYNSIFKNSTNSDIIIGNTGEFSFRDNTSINSQAFLKVTAKQYPANITLQSNTIIDPIASIAIDIRNQGPVVMIDNIIRSRSTANAPVVFHATTTSSDLFSMGNTFTVSNPIYSTGRNIIYDKAVASLSSLSGLSEPILPGTQPNLNRTVLEIPLGANSTAIQAIINQASMLSGTRPVVHLPFGIYNISNTLNIPAGADMQIVGDGGTTKLFWTGNSAGQVINIAGPSKVALRDLSIDGNGIATNILMTNIDQVGAMIFMHEAEVNSNHTNLFVNGLDNALVLAYNSSFLRSMSKSISVVGGPLSASGNPQMGRTILYGALQAVNKISNEVTNGGNLLLRDVWYESSENSPFVNLPGQGIFLLEGSHISSPINTILPQMSFTNFSGKATLLNNLISDRVLISGNGSQTKFLGLGVQFGNYSSPVLPPTNTYIENSSMHAGDIRSLNSRANNDPNLASPRSGSYQVNNIGISDSSFIATMIASSRDVHAQILTSLPTGVTDVRFYRIWSYNGLKGIDIEGNGTVLPVKFLSVNSECKNGKVNVTWKISQAGELQKFDVERNDNGTGWKVIATVKALSNSSFEKSYNYNDNKINYATNIYRIVAYDSNSNKSFSNVIKSTCSAGNANFVIYPNPVKQSASITITATEASNVELSIYNNSGAVVKKIQTQVVSGNNSISIDMKGLPSGNYSVQANWGNNMKTAKLVKID